MGSMSNLDGSHNGDQGGWAQSVSESDLVCSFVRADESIPFFVAIHPEMKHFAQFIPIDRFPD